MIQLSIIIPFLSDQGPREKAFEWLVKFYKKYCPTAEICIGSSDEPFSKAKAVNKAAKEARGSILAIIDADIICNPSVLNEAPKLLSIHPWIIPYNEVRNLTEESTNLLLHLSPTWPPPSHLTFNTRTMLPVGGINIMKKESFEAVGGFDERFQGWGGEDDAFAAAMNTICGHYMRTNDAIYHLWHPLADHKKNEHYNDNVLLARRYCRAQGKRNKMRKILAERNNNEKK